MYATPRPALPNALISFLIVWVFASCSAGPIAKAKAMDPTKVPAAIEEARLVDVSVADSDALASYVGSMLSVLETPGLETDQRAVAQSYLEKGAEALSERSTSPRDLEDLALGDMPARIAVPSGLRGAQLLYEDDERSDAFRLIQRVDQRYPSHAFRDEAGDLLWRIGDSYAKDTRKRLFLFPYSNRAPGVYEYLSTEYPTHEKSDEALVELARIYTEDRLFDLAIEKHRELLLWGRDSPFRIRSEAEIPRLRLADLDGPAYDRDAMLLSLSELEAWIQSHPQHELRPDVDRTLVDCLQRLADNDLIVAEFYSTVKSRNGARQHAERALEFAKRAGNPEQEAEVRAFLASVDEIEQVDSPLIVSEGLPDAFQGDSGLGITGPAGLSDSLPTTPKRPEPRSEPDEDQDDESGLSGESGGSSGGNSSGGSGGSQ